MRLEERLSKAACFRPSPTCIPFGNTGWCSPHCPILHTSTLFPQRNVRNTSSAPPLDYISRIETRYLYASSTTCRNRLQQLSEPRYRTRGICSMEPFLVDSLFERIETGRSIYQNPFTRRGHRPCLARSTVRSTDIGGAESARACTQRVIEGLEGHNGMLQFV